MKMERTLKISGETIIFKYLQREIRTQLQTYLDQPVQEHWSHVRLQTLVLLYKAFTPFVALLLDDCLCASLSWRSPPVGSKYFNSDPKTRRICFAIITWEEAEATGELHDTPPQRPCQKSQCQGRPGGHLVVPAGSEIGGRGGYDDDCRHSYRIGVGYWSQIQKIHRTQVGGEYCGDLVFPKNQTSGRQKHQQQGKKGGHTFSVRNFDSGRTLFLLLCWRKRAFNREDLETADFEPFKTIIHIQSVKNSRSLTTFNFILAACSHLFFEWPLQNQIHSHYLLLIIPIIN